MRTKPTPAEKRRERQAIVAEETHQRAPVRGRTPGQSQYLQAIKTQDTVIATGPAGTGKTFIASSYAAEMVMAGEITRIILCRPAVEACGENLGFLPGDLARKMEPWTVPIISVLKLKLGGGKVDLMLREGKISVVPFAYMRGLTFDGAFVILDEAQNTTPAQMKLFTTRIGEASKVVINGDVRQSDIPTGNGLDAVTEIVRSGRMENQKVALVEMTNDDIVRSAQCRAWIEGWEWHDDDPNRRDRVCETGLRRYLSA